MKKEIVVRVHEENGSVRVERRGVDHIEVNAVTQILGVMTIGEAWDYYPFCSSDTVEVTYE